MDAPEEWHVIAWSSFRLPEKVACTAAELEAVAGATAFVKAYLQGYQQAGHAITHWRPTNYAKSPTLKLYVNLS